MRKCPCSKVCERRKLGCHGFCEDYQQWRKERDEFLGQKNREKESRFNRPPEKMKYIRDKMRWR